jgi:hypothetical protein
MCVVPNGVDQLDAITDLGGGSILHSRVALNN